MGSARGKPSMTGVQRKKQSKKVIEKLKNLRKKGKLKRHVVDAYREINTKKYATGRRQAANIEEDWKKDREIQLANQEDDDILPLDMLDADIDWENSAFAGKVARMRNGTEAIDDGDDGNDEDIESKKRRFEGEPSDDVHEMLPIKIDGKLLKRSRRISESSLDTGKEGDGDLEAKQSDTWKEEDFSGLSTAQLLNKRMELLDRAKQEISGQAYAILAEPQQETSKLRSLIRMCHGEEVHSLIRESVQKLASASVAQIFVDIIPGYAIRELTEEEQSQKMKKETKKLKQYEETLLRNYTRYLQFLEKNVMKLIPRNGNVLHEETFTYALALVSLRSLCKLLLSVPHFNFSTNIIGLLVRLTTSKSDTVIDECCETLSQLFASDVSLRCCAFGARSIAALVNEKKCDVAPKLLTTFLKMNIKEVDRGDRGKEKQRLLSKRFQLAKERQSKTRAKYTKQLKKLEVDLKEAEAAESLSTKLKYATEAMKHVFVTYFRVIKHMPTCALLEPVLEGLSKFAHLLNVEFFDDIIAALQTLVDQQHIRVLDSLYCIHAVFVILSGEGVALNVDPFRFYKSMYRLIANIPFEKRPEVQEREMLIVLQTLDMMINKRRKQVALCRVAAFTKRLLDISFLLPTVPVIAILAAIRTFFISHPRLSMLLENNDEMAGNGIFMADVDNPDCCNALSSNIVAEVELLSKHPNQLIVQFAKHIRAGVPSLGANHLSGDITTVQPYQWIERSRSNHKGIDKPQYFNEQLSLFCKKRNKQLTSKNAQLIVNEWLTSTK